MIDPEYFIKTLMNQNIGFFTGVPDSLLKSISSYLLDHLGKKEHIISANEGNAVGLATGYHLATGKIAMVYLQNSGLGNIINPILSIVDPKIYSIPMLLLIGWRGEPGVKDEPQHFKQGKVTLPLLKSMGISYRILSPDMTDSDFKKVFKSALSKMKKSSAPFALVVSKNSFKKYDRIQQKTESKRPGRESVVQEILSGIGSNSIIVSTTGMISREVFEYRTKNDQSHDRDFLTIGGMGHANQIAMGIAQQQKNRPVICLDGDGALIMHMGSLCINGCLKQENFKHIILNNGAHDSVGGQPTAGETTDFAAIAKAAGYSAAKSIQTIADLKLSLTWLNKTPGPLLLEIKVKKGARADLGRPTVKPVDFKKTFMEFLKDG